jgi:hypothetical protein
MLKSKEWFFAASIVPNVICRVLAKAFDSYPGGAPSDLFVATKGGMVRTNNAENSAAAWMTGFYFFCSRRDCVQISTRCLSV